MNAGVGWGARGIFGGGGWEVGREANVSFFFWKEEGENLSTCSQEVWTCGLWKPNRRLQLSRHIKLEVIWDFFICWRSSHFLNFFNGGRIWHCKISHLHVFICQILHLFGKLYVQSFRLFISEILHGSSKSDNRMGILAQDADMAPTELGQVL